MSMARWALFSVFGSALLASGCGSSIATEAKMAAAPEDLVLDADLPLEAPLLPPIPPSAPEEERPLLGARHDLEYAGPASDVCRCLAVRVEESAEAPALRWSVAPPQLDSSSQWVVALSSQGVRCEGAPQGSPGASYQGYEARDGDVIVFVEASSAGRPLTSGGIIPRPAAGGSVFVEALGSVYGKPLQGDQARCKVPTPAVAAAPLAASVASEGTLIRATDSPSSGVRFAQSPANSSSAGSAASPAVLSGAAAVPPPGGPSGGALPAAPARSSASATAAARPINDGCDDSLYWTDKAGKRRLKPHCF
jgi:hypothetical protein